jgi:hypothetical protein
MVEVGYLSQKARVEYDCAQEQSRSLAVSFHSGNMADGKIVYADDEARGWEPVFPGTFSEALRKAACNKGG